MFNLNTRYGHDRKLYLIRLLLYNPFSCTWSCFFFLTAHITFQLSMCLSFQLYSFKLLRLAFQFMPARKKGSHTFYFRRFWSATSYYSSPNMSADYCHVYTSQVYCMLHFHSRTSTSGNYSNL